MRRPSSTSITIAAVAAMTTMACSSAEDADDATTEDMQEIATHLGGQTSALPSGTCRTDADCTGGYGCFYRASTVLSTCLGPGQNQPPACRSDADCRVGFRCSRGYGETGTCRYFGSLPTPCTSDAQCNSAQSCVAFFNPSSIRTERKCQNRVSGMTCTQDVECFGSFCSRPTYAPSGKCR